MTQAEMEQYCFNLIRKPPNWIKRIDHVKDIPMDIKVSRIVITANGQIGDGIHYLAWSDLYPIWQRLGYSRVNPKKGEKCPR